MYGPTASSARGGVKRSMSTLGGARTTRSWRPSRPCICLSGRGPQAWATYPWPPLSRTVLGKGACLCCAACVAVLCCTRIRPCDCVTHGPVMLVLLVVVGTSPPPPPPRRVCRCSHWVSGWRTTRRTHSSLMQFQCGGEKPRSVASLSRLSGMRHCCLEVRFSLELVVHRVVLLCARAVRVPTRWCR